ncbi:MAG: polysaccharide biosynthesis/export family protein [Pseudomonadota bacterium]|jgi:polysaccharide export outer membrane protein
MKIKMPLLGGWLFAALLLIASPGHAQSAATPADAAKTPAAVDAGYRIGAGDVLEISVWKEDTLKKEVLVRPDGGISFPLVGSFDAAGKTAAQLQQEISQKLDKFIPDAVVSVALLKVISNTVYVIGKVNKPGDYVAGSYVDVMQALSMAGGLTPFAAENDIKVLRRDGSGEVALPFQYAKVKKGEKLEQNILLKGGDVVVVP